LAAPADRDRNSRTLNAKKSWRRGTHRTVGPSRTIEQVEPHARKLGITRVANVTGLDYLGVPVFMAVRPNARSLSVAQGKGLTEECAIASALMEAAEIAHAEDVRKPVMIASFSALQSRADVAEPDRLVRLKGHSFDRSQEIAWIEGVDVAAGVSVYVPFELVHTDFTVPPRLAGAGLFASSNGLASGNHRLEAACAGVCELIERDAMALWAVRGPKQRAARRVRLETIRDADCRTLLGQLAERQMSVAVWDATTDVGVACFLCRLTERPANTRSALGPFWGSGCHLDRGIALTRAITESAQARLTLIAGSRDDLTRRDYNRAGERMLTMLVRDKWEESVTSRSFSDAPSDAAEDFAADLGTLVERLGAAGLSQTILVDLTDERFDIPVVRAIIPGLEGYDPAAPLRPGMRARRARKEGANA
jgi:YcaO-like protein with predicted kinase domain